MKFIREGVEEMVKLWELGVEEEDWKSVVEMGNELLEYYMDIVEKRREYGKKYRSKVEKDREELKKLKEWKEKMLKGDISLGEGKRMNEELENKD
jgi:hypothetical protein